MILAGGLHRDIKDTYFRVGHMGVSALEPQRGHITKVHTYIHTYGGSSSYHSLLWYAVWVYRCWQHWKVVYKLLVIVYHQVPPSLLSPNNFTLIIIIIHWLIRLIVIRPLAYRIVTMSKEVSSGTLHLLPLTSRSIVRQIRQVQHESRDEHSVGWGWTSSYVHMYGAQYFNILIKRFGLAGMQRKME